MEDQEIRQIFTEFINTYDFWPYPIPGYPDYTINRLGQIWDKNGNQIVPYNYPNQYKMVYLKNEYGHRVWGIHQLVAMTFNSQWFDGCVVHHKDEDKTNNIDNNLQPMTVAEHGRLHANIKYHDKIMTCQVCGNQFIWTVEQQRRYYIDLQRNKIRFITCSKACSSYIGRMIQLGKEPILKYYI